MGETLSPFTKQSHDAKTIPSMANPNPSPLTRFPRPGTPKPVNLLRDAREAEQLMIQAIRNAPVTTESLTGYAALVRAFVALVDCIQRLRGIPLPGSLRPDLDPVQAARMIKRLKARQPIDLEQITEGRFHYEPEPTKKSPSKESISKDQGVTAEGEGEGAKTDGGSL